MTYWLCEKIGLCEKYGAHNRLFSSGKNSRTIKYVQKSWFFGSYMILN